MENLITHLKMNSKKAKEADWKGSFVAGISAMSNQELFSEYSTVNSWSSHELFSTKEEYQLKILSKELTKRLKEIKFL